MSGELAKVKVPEKFKKRSVGDVSRFFTIDTMDRDMLDGLARSTNSHFMYVHTFRYDKDTLLGVGFSGQEVDAYVDMEEYVAHLEIM